MLNLNVPNLPLAQIRGVRRAHLANTGLNFVTRVNDKEPAPVAETDPAVGNPAMTPESDDTLTEAGWAVVTALSSVTEDPRPEVGHFMHAAIEAASKLLTFDRQYSDNPYSSR